MAAKWGHGLLQVRSAVRVGSVAVRGGSGSVVGSSWCTVEVEFRVRPVGDVADPRRLGRQLSKIESLLTGSQPFTRGRHQQRQLRVAVGRADVLDIHDFALVQLPRA